MKKQVTICFRTSDDLRSALEQVAREDRRSLSSVIELILMDHVEKNRQFLGKAERRRFMRRPVAIPAFVWSSESENGRYGAVVLDLSLGGLSLSLPADSVAELGSNNNTQFETSFALPERVEPIKLLCKPERVVPSSAHVIIGASFVDAEFENYRQLQQYLI